MRLTANSERGRTMHLSSQFSLLRRSSQALAVMAVSMLGCAASLAVQSTQSAGLPAPGAVRAQHLSVELIPLTGTIQPGTGTDVGLHFVLDKGWHVYWTNAGDSGEPPKIDWKLPAGITASPMQFPAPQRLPLGPLMDFGYEDEVLFPMTLQAGGEVKAPATVQLQAHVNWLVCREVCIPGKADLALPLAITTQPGKPGAAALALFTRFRERLPRALPPGYRAVFAPNAKGFTLAILNPPDGQVGSSMEFFPLDQAQIDNPSPQVVKPIAHGLEVSLNKDQNLQGTLAKLNGVIVLPDGNAYEVHAIPGAVPAGSQTEGLWISGGLGNLLRIVLLAFAGGVVLNLMPCVFPVLFIKGLALLGSSGEARSRMRAHGAAYALGILVSFWAVVAILLGLRATGNHLGWGFQFQSPTFLAIIALFLFFLGLSLAGMFEIGLTLTSAGSSLAAKQGYTGSFFTGVLATIVATPCTAPFMGTAIGFALGQSAAVAFAIFTSLALGLAAPYVMLALNPAWTRLLPRPGAWMEILKQATAVPIFATVIWLVWLFTESAGVNGLPGLLAAFLLLAAAGWILGRWPTRPVASAFALLVILLAIAAPVYMLEEFPAPELSTAQAAGAGDAGRIGNAVWQPFSVAAVENYRVQGRPVFVDFTADWCLSCQVNERVVLDRPDVQQRLRDSGIVLIRADWTRHDDSIAEALNSLGRSGIPTYVIYMPGAPARILPEVLTPGIVFGALNELRAGTK
jgi:thiol:disulfide interchange protein/DsbC/DsbD-like thiol-disulfide interchange protein